MPQYDITDQEAVAVAAALDVSAAMLTVLGDDPADVLGLADLFRSGLHNSQPGTSRTAGGGENIVSTLPSRIVPIHGPSDRYAGRDRGPAGPNPIEAA